MAYPYLSYAVTEAYCMIFAATVWFRLNSSIGSEHEVKQLRYMIYSYFGLLITDILWALSQDKLLQPPHLVSMLINAVADISVTGGCYFWFRFIEDRLHLRGSRNKLLNSLITVPLLLVCVLDLCTVFTGLMFTVDAENHYIENPIYRLASCINYLYLVVPTACSVFRALKARSRPERSEFWTYALYMFVPITASLLEDVFPYVPLVAVNIFLMILVLFLMIQNMQVYNDALTGLGNRRRLNQHLSNCLDRATPERPTLLFIMDINSFKSINDTFGHIEGDCALKTFARILRQVANRYYAFIARYGGDEFCFVTDVEDCDPAQVMADIQQTLADEQQKIAAGPEKYRMTVSIGYAVCDGTEQEPTAALARADQMLYKNKQLWHLKNG